MADEPSIVARIQAVLDDSSLADFKARIENALQGVNLFQLNNINSIDNAMAKLDQLKAKYAEAAAAAEEASTKAQAADDQQAQAANALADAQAAAQQKAGDAVQAQEDRITQLVLQGTEKRLQANNAEAEQKTKAAQDAANKQAEADAKATQAIIDNADKRAAAVADADARAAAASDIRIQRESDAIARENAANASRIQKSFDAANAQIEASDRAEAAQISADQRAAESHAAAVAREAQASQDATDKEITNAEKVAQAEAQAADQTTQGWQKAFQSLSQGNIGGAVSGVAQGLGIDQEALSAAATVAAAAASVGLMVGGIVNAYNSSQDLLGQMQLVRRETGLTADEASKLNAALTFTMNPNSPFALFSFGQLQANVQNMADYDAGLITLNAQQQTFVEGMQKLGISARDSSGNVKSATTVLLEMSQALNSMPGPERAQAIQEIGGRFGRDIAAVANVNPALLQETFNQALQVSQQQLDFTDQRKEAVQAATLAEQQFNIELSKAIGPLDIIIQRIKVDLLKAITDAVDAMGHLAPGQTPTTNALGQPVPTGPGQSEGSIMVAMQQAMLDQPQQAFITNLTQQMINKYGPGGTANAPQSPAAADAARQASAKVQLDDYKNGLANLKVALDNYTDSVKAADAAEKSRIANNVATSKAFNSDIGSIISLSHTYDSYYTAVDKTQDSIDKLMKKSNEWVTTYSINGQTPTGTAAQIDKYIKDVRTAQANDLYQQQIQGATLQTAQERIAAANAPRTSISSRGRVSTRPGQPETASQALRLRYAQEGTPVQQVREQIDEEKLAAEAQALGLRPGEAVTPASIQTGAVRRGLSPDEAQQLADLYDQMNKLDLGNKETEFNTMRGAIDQFTESMAKGGASTDDVNKALGLAGDNLQYFADKSGLFESVGFSRAVAEAALNTQLANGEFGKGPDAIQKYTEKAQALYDTLDKLKNPLAGTKPLDLATAIGTGLIPGGALPPGLEAAGALTLDAKGQVVGTSQATQKLLDQIRQQNRLTAPERRGGAFNPEAPAATPAEIADALRGATPAQQEEIRIATNQVGPAETMQLAAKALGIDIGKAFQQTANLVVKMNNQDPTDYVGQMQQKLQDFNKIAIDLHLTFNGTEPKELLRQYQQDIADMSNNPNFKPPTGGGTPPAEPWSLFMPTGAGTGAGGEALKPPTVTVPWQVDDTTGNKNSQNVALLDIVSNLQDTANTKPVLEPTEVDRSSKTFAQLDAQATEVLHHLIAWWADHPITVTIQQAPPPGAAGASNPPNPLGTHLPTTALPVQGPPSPPPPIFQNPLPHRDIGGSVQGGKPYYIGPREMFVPGGDGAVLGPDLTMRLGRERPISVGHYGDQTANTINIDARGAATPRETVRQVGEAATAYFLSDDPALRTRQDRWRRGTP